MKKTYSINGFLGRFSDEEVSLLLKAGYTPKEVEKYEANKIDVEEVEYRLNAPYRKWMKSREAKNV